MLGFHPEYTFALIHYIKYMLADEEESIYSLRAAWYCDVAAWGQARVEKEAACHLPRNRDTPTRKHSSRGVCRPKP